jgi:hypothetical protein
MMVEAGAMRTLIALAALVSLAFVSPDARANDNPLSCREASKQSLDNHLTEEKLIWSQEGGQVRDVQYEPIYHEKTNKCFFKLNFKIVKSGELMSTYYLVDAFENRIYAAYLAVTKRAGSLAKEPPLNCTYGVVYDEKTSCTTKAELDGFVKSLIAQN